MLQNPVFVLNQNREPLNPVHPAVARMLIDGGSAAILRHRPFTIIMNVTVEEETEPLRVCVDPGSRGTGMVLVEMNSNRLVFAMEIEHRGEEIKKSLEQRRAVRRSRRSRHCRHREPRFLNRTRPSGWLPPSIRSRIANIATWVDRLFRSARITQVNLEDVKFDTQLLRDPDVRGRLYQEGSRGGLEIKEFLLDVWQHRCAYCGKTGVPLEVEHVIPKSRSGSDRIDNLVIACHACNQKKGGQTAAEFGFPDVQTKVKPSLRDAAVMNAMRNELRKQLEAHGIPVVCSSGGLTKFNRTQAEYPKTHWIDAACVGEEGEGVILDPNQKILAVKAMGRGCRQMCRVNKFGFPRSGPKGSRTVRGFRTGDLVVAKVPSGKYVGTHRGRVAVRASGDFDLNDGGRTFFVSWKNCRELQNSDGYRYLEVRGGDSSHG